MTREDAVRRFTWTSKGNQGQLLALQDHLLSMMPTDRWDRCRACNIHNESFAPVSSVGCIDADVVVMGRNPGGDEDKPSQGISFIGRGGQLLHRLVESTGLTQDQVYYVNTVKCFTSVPENNRPPTADEYNACIETWTKPELQLLTKPKMLLTLGADICALMTGGQQLKAVRRTMMTYGEDQGFLAGVHLICCTHMGAALRNGVAYGDIQRDFEFVGLKLRELEIVAKEVA